MEARAPDGSFLVVRDGSKARCTRVAGWGRHLTQFGFHVLGVNAELSGDIESSATLGANEVIPAIDAIRNKFTNPLDFIDG